MVINSKYTQSQTDGYTQVSLGSVLIATRDDKLKLGIMFDSSLPANDAEPQIVFTKGASEDKLYPGNMACYVKVLNADGKAHKFTALDVS